VPGNRPLTRWHPAASLFLPVLAGVLLALSTTDPLAQTPPSEKRARELYTLAASHFATNRGSVTAAWEYGRAAYDLGDLLQDNKERKNVAQAGIDACRHAVALDPNSAPVHYYLALNLGELARSKKISSLKLLHEMEHELLKAAQIDPAFDYGGPDRSLGMLYLEAPAWPASVGNRTKARSHLETAAQLSPEYPDNHLCLAEAYVQWGELKNLDQELKELDELFPKARTRFAGDNWTATWHDWQTRLAKLQKNREHLVANPPISPGERGARRMK
jgi:hypothetical protein